MDKRNYLNVGCGGKFHKAWTNVDMNSASPHVKVHNLLNGFPYQNNQFDVVYHSQVLEHFPKEKGERFLSECFRVLKPNGILRAVVPDLENIAKEYLRCLNENLKNPTKIAEANYDWIMLEMYDQTVRNYSGGQMAEFLSQPNLINEKYVIDRIGFVGRTIVENSRKHRENYLTAAANGKRHKKITIKKVLDYGLRQLKKMYVTEAQKIGSFRLGGEIHMWMYDRFSLSRLLSQVGFEKIEVMSPYKSMISDWNIYELDVKDGVVFDPTSLFMEASKPNSATAACAMNGAKVAQAPHLKR
jgi:predicted SAM-dependent methyltransferase